MKKIVILCAAILSINMSAEAFELSVGECFLIKENKLKNYIPKEEAEKFILNPFNTTIKVEEKKYTMELQNESISKRYKIYKVCVSENK